MRSALLTLLGLGVLVGLVMAANLRHDPEGREVDWRIVKPPPREVSVALPSRGLIVQTVAAPGAVEPVEEAQIASQIVGRVIAVNVREGDRVHEGDVLVKLDPTEAQARLDSVEARIARLRAAIEQAEAERSKSNRDLERIAKLASRGVATPTELADARSTLTISAATLSMSKNELNESEAMRRMNQQELDRTEIRASDRRRGG